MENLCLCSDEQLVLSTSKGDNVAFEKLWGRYGVIIHSYIIYFVKDPNQAEDLFQETSIRAFITIRAGNYAHSNRIEAWLKRIAYNLIIDYFRQKRAQNQISLESDGYNVLNHTKYSDETIEDRLVKSQIEDDLRMLISYLPDNQREVLVMRYYKGLVFREIALRTGVGVNTALGRMRYALIKIRKMAKDNNITLSVR